MVADFELTSMYFLIRSLRAISIMTSLGHSRLPIISFDSSWWAEHDGVLNFPLSFLVRSNLRKSFQKIGHFPFNCPRLTLPKIWAKDAVGRFESHPMLFSDVMYFSHFFSINCLSGNIHSWRNLTFLKIFQQCIFSDKQFFLEN